MLRQIIKGNPLLIYLNTKKSPAYGAGIQRLDYRGCVMVAAAAIHLFIIIFMRLETLNN